MISHARVYGGFNILLRHTVYKLFQSSSSTQTWEHGMLLLHIVMAISLPLLYFQLNLQTNQ